MYEKINRISSILLLSQVTFIVFCFGGVFFYYEEDVDGMEVRQKKLDIFQFIIHSTNDAINVKSRWFDCQFIRKAAVIQPEQCLSAKSEDDVK